MAYNNLKDFIERLENEGQLIRIKTFVDPKLEITEVADRMIKRGGKALLFENTGTDFPVLINAFGSDQRIGYALGVDHLDQPFHDLEAMLEKVMGAGKGFKEKIALLGTLKKVSSWMPRSIKGKGACQEVVMEDPDITRLPVLTCWPFDGGPFITLPVVHTVDPVTGSRNAGMYRMQVFGPKLCGMHWHLHKDSARHFRHYAEKGLRMPVSVTLGGDPACTYAATAPLPSQVDEMMLAGFLRKKKVTLVKCLTNDLEVPSDADFVIEGYIDPTEDLILEGPFGDHTGFYSLADYYPRFHITCITHRKGAVYPATVVGIPPMEDAWMGKATERIFLFPIRVSMLPEVQDIYMPPQGVFHNVVLVSIKKEYEGQAIKVMNALWGAGQMMFNKIMIVFSDGVDLQDVKQVLAAIADQVNPASDLVFSKGPADALDHSSQEFAYGGKLGIDATEKGSGWTGSAMVQSAQWRETTKDFPDISVRLPWPDLPLAIVFLKNRSKDEIRELHKGICNSPGMEQLRFVVFCDEECSDLDPGGWLWLAANHLDPARDCYLSANRSGSVSLGLDATSKRKGKDGFTRDWPNPVIMDEKTIEIIDRKWSELGLAEFTPSPSLKYRGLSKGDSAVAMNDVD